jgi:predicted enzyme related to lactoylglutathione lyase
MPQRDGYQPGTPCWVDLMSPDIEGSKAFYTGLFGWDAETTLMPDGSHMYTRMTKDGLAVCGLGGTFPGMENAPAIWNSYVWVDSAEDTAALIDKAGGKVVLPPMQVMEHGTMCVAQDPLGATFSLWQPDQHRGAQIVNEPDTYSWNELLSSDVEAAKNFYSQVFGWEYQVMDMGPGGPYSVVQGGESGGLAGLMGRPPGYPAQAPDSWLVYFTVADIAAKAAAAEAAGATCVTGPMEIPGIGTIAAHLDPHHGMFAMMQPASG